VPTIPRPATARPRTACAATFAAALTVLTAYQVELTVDAAGPSAQAASAIQGAAAAGYREGFVTSEGRRIHYLDWGASDKPAFIMLHGISRSGHSYDHIAPHFTDDYRVIAMDLRGHGDSDWSPNGAYLVEDFVKDLHALVEQLTLRDIVLVGCSMGGRVVQVYAGMYPDRVKKVIAEDVGPERPETVTRGLTERIKREMEGWASEEELFASLRRNARVSEEIHRSWLRWDTKKLANGRVAWKYDPNVTQGLGPIELWDYIKKIKAPALYMVGARSNIVPLETQQQLRALPNVEVVTIPDAGHYPHEETPEVFLAVVKAFLAG
jgi:pimeloyl-ACP methyl ester carboxylesterase